MDMDGNCLSGQAHLQGNILAVQQEFERISAELDERFLHEYGDAIDISKNSIVIPSQRSLNANDSHQVLPTSTPGDIDSRDEMRSSHNNTSLSLHKILTIECATQTYQSSSQSASQTPDTTIMSNNHQQTQTQKSYSVDESSQTIIPEKAVSSCQTEGISSEKLLEKKDMSPLQEQGRLLRLEIELLEGFIEKRKKMTVMPEESNVTTYSIAGKALKLDSEKDVEDIVKAIKEMDDVTDIIFSGNTFGVDASKAVALALKEKKGIRRVDFSDIFTGRLREEIPHALVAFGDAFIDQAHLTELDLSDNAFGPAGAEPLGSLLTNNRSLKILRLHNNGLGPEGGKMIANALIAAQALNEKEEKTSNLESIVIGRNRLENGSSADLSKAFECHKNLKEVRLPQNGIRPEGIETLMTGLRQCKGLESLDLQDNTFTEKGSKALAESIKFWPSLKSLNIGDCLLKATGSIDVIQAIQNDPPVNLEFLNFQFNEMNEKGAALLASTLGQLPNLSTLMLNGNEFNPEGTAAEAIRSNLERAGQEDILDSWSDMDYDSEEEEEEEEEEKEAPVKEDEKEKSIDDITSVLENVTI